jgi:hypothetical protein
MAKHEWIGATHNRFESQKNSDEKKVSTSIIHGIIKLLMCL